MEMIGQDILRLLNLQQGYYVALKQAIQRQTVYIEAMDTGRLTAGTSEVRGVMRKIRDVEARLRPLRQSWGTLGIDRPAPERREIDALSASMRALITEIQDTKEHNENLLEAGMRQVRKQMAGLNSHSKAAQAYFRRPAQAARFVDKAN